ncbi:MAG TPA: hypothetical protein VGP12_02810 [Nitrosospira sp.]|jgi:hypothetical protein|nr:hypothetical protein [Nitrosospira sp.]
MADEADMANENADRMLESILRNGRQQAETQIHPRQDGTCFNDCGDPAMQGAAFCSKECAEDVEKRMKLAGLSGAFTRAAEGTE